MTFETNTLKDYKTVKYNEIRYLPKISFWFIIGDHVLKG